MNTTEKDKITDTILDSQLIKSVRRRIRSYRKTDFLEVLSSSLLNKRIPLSVQCNVDTVQAFRDAVREDIILNGVRFVGDYRAEAFVSAVKRIVQKFIPDEKFLEVSDRVMRRCSRTHSGADSYFALQELFACPDLLIKPRQGDNPPLHVTLGLDRLGVFKCRICVANLYGIYRNDDIEYMLTQREYSLVPLVSIDTVIVENMDFLSNTTSRHLSLRTLEPQLDLHSEIRELF